MHTSIWDAQIRGWVDLLVRHRHNIFSVEPNTYFGFQLINSHTVCAADPKYKKPMRIDVLRTNKCRHFTRSNELRCLFFMCWVCVSLLSLVVLCFPRITWALIFVFVSVICVSLQSSWILIPLRVSSIVAGEFLSIFPFSFILGSNFSFRKSKRISVVETVIKVEP